MAKFFKSSTSSKLELQEFITAVKSLYNKPEDLTDDVIYQLSELLQQLANNKQWLPEVIAKEVTERHNTLDVGNIYGNDALVIHVNRQPFFQIRVCFWNPLGNLKKPDEMFDVYQSAHDHNFAFLTTNYYGPGYVSCFYKYKYKSNYRAGDVVSIERQQDHQLKSGHVVFYEPSKDIHLQRPPEAFSISVNLMFELNDNKQYVFNITKNEIQEVVLSSNDTAKEFVNELLARI